MRRAVRSGSRRTAERLRLLFSSRGAGFRRLGQAHAGSVAGDTLVAMALAGTLFFQVPSTQARERVALYLLITLAPFAVLGPFLGRIFERFPTAYRSGMVASAGLRAFTAIVMAFQLDSIVLFPLAFALLVMSRFHGIARSSVLPVVLSGPHEVITANAQIARIGVLGTAAVAPFGFLGIWGIGAEFVLVLAAGVFVASAVAARGLPQLDVVLDAAARRSPMPRPVRLARFATAAVRLLNGFLLLLVAFELKEVDAGALDFSAVLAAGGAGFFLAALLTPAFDRYLSEEPMVVAGLAVEAAAAFVAAQVFGLGASAVLALAAGLAWGTAKFGFDGLLQATIPTAARGRAFTNAETFFQFAWVLGALVPVVLSVPIGLGLTLAGLLALFIQVVYISAVLVPVVAERRRESGPAEEADLSRDIMDLM